MTEPTVVVVVVDDDDVCGFGHKVKFVGHKMIKATCTFIDLYPARIDEVSSFSRRPVNFCLDHPKCQRKPMPVVQIALSEFRNGVLITVPRALKDIPTSASNNSLQARRLR